MTNQEIERLLRDHGIDTQQVKAQVFASHHHHEQVGRWDVLCFDYYSRRYLELRLPLAGFELLAMNERQITIQELQKV